MTYPTWHALSCEFWAWWFTPEGMYWFFIVICLFICGRIIIQERRRR
jgi:hypothetical protein